MRKKQYMEEQTIGVPRLTGAGNSWPFLYQGMEHEITDPAPLYFDHGANVYNPMLQRELSQLGPQGIAGPPTAGAAEGGMGKGFGGTGPSQGFGNPGGLSGGRIASNLLTVASAYLRVNSPIGFDFGGGESPIPIPILGGTVGGFLEWLGVGGGSDHSLPRQMQKGRHYIWPVVGIGQGLTPTQKSKAAASGDPITVTGEASYYLPSKSQPGKCACDKYGFRYKDPKGFTAAMIGAVGPTGHFPCGSEAEVTFNPPHSNVPRTVRVKVIDSGPYVAGRVIDLSPGAFKALAGPYADEGHIPVTVQLPATPEPPLQTE